MKMNQQYKKFWEDKIKNLNNNHLLDTIEVSMKNLQKDPRHIQSKHVLELSIQEKNRRQMSSPRAIKLTEKLLSSGLIDVSESPTSSESENCGKHVSRLCQL